MMPNFWQELPKPFFVLAPMEDVTDVAFRHVVQEAAAPDVFFTEFTNAESYNHPEGQISVRGRLAFTEDEKPIVAHIWGDNPDHFKKMAFDMADRGFSGMDLNMGCPVQNVVRHGRGSGLINHQDKAIQLIQATKEAPLPVSVKTRLGFNDIAEMDQWLPKVFEQDIVNLSIHLRTRKEMSNYDAHWDLIPEIVAMRDAIAPQTLLTINGDIPNRQVGEELVDKYGVDGIMIGRGIFHNPFAFEKEAQDHSPEEHIALFRRHLDLFDQYEDVIQRPFKSLRRSFKIYIRNIKGASKLRQALMTAETSDQAREFLDEFQRDYL
ncbi:tRNA dihydrouridine synthase [Aerococcus kribbianus]|uniref:tRNA-dihydrouridine synthase n=1 Tax=Aerococcus kribbianus TaxID=2999064 RepID=A0A9X3FV97_9LACT|nr:MULTISPECIES: tRNA-dihydrouridine synthase [unclassified Aerococcus]MCZ0716879.1 tRNA-dihydrouridine synthase [Aerococcus sp. YH-aer221]MCZ0725167.1 tRNA-dihydrouridine synthase [Aerococcus sp. YH-aer222]